jgi:hypothetical protein
MAVKNALNVIYTLKDQLTVMVASMLIIVFSSVVDPNPKFWPGPNPKKSSDTDIAMK